MVMTGSTVTFTIDPSQRSAVISRFLPAAAGLVLSMLVVPSSRAEGSLFNAVGVDLSKFVLVSAPIGTGDRSQLNIYEQRSDKRPCFAVSGSSPAVVDPLLSGFDFSGICNRYIDGNGYSLRIGGDDLGTRYRLTVVKTGSDIELLAAPTRDRSQPTILVARAGGYGSGFIKLNFEPGWMLRRRAYGKKTLGHIYIYRDVQAMEAEVPEPSETDDTADDAVESAGE